MKKQLLYLLICLFLSLNSFVIFYTEKINRDEINDGPYIFYMHGKLKVKWVENNILREDIIIQGNFSEIKNKFNLLCNYKDLIDNHLQIPNYFQSYERIDSISIVTDVRENTKLIYKNETFYKGSITGKRV